MIAQQHHTADNLPAARFLLLLIPVALAIFGVLGLGLVRENAENHARTKHSAAVVDSIHRCLERNGPHETWQSNSWRTPGRRFLACRDDDGLWGIAVLQKTRTGWIERTAFRIKEGTYEQLKEYLSARATPMQ